MSESNDPVYGRGYKYMNSLLEKHGWEKLVSILRDNHNQSEFDYISKL